MLRALTFVLACTVGGPAFAQNSHLAEPQNRRLEQAAIEAGADEEAARSLASSILATLGEDDQLLPSLKPTVDLVPGDQFGWSVALSGDRALVGAREDADVDNDAGAVYVLDYDGSRWRLTQKLAPADLELGDYFGASVSLDGDRALIGAWASDDDGSSSGSAYVFDLVDGTWTETQKLTADDARASSLFGWSVSLSGDHAMIGAFGNDTSANRGTGSAYAFTLVDGAWTQTQKLIASDAERNDHFGSAVSISGDRALVGAKDEDQLGRDAGAAYMFNLVDGVWTETHKLLPFEGTRWAFFYFGTSVALDGDRAIVGAPGGQGVTSEEAGSVYVFDMVDGTWIETQELEATNASVGDAFGASVALEGDRALIGAFGYDFIGEERGTAYVFDLADGLWTQTDRLIAGDGDTTDRFGAGVALSGDRAFIGAPGAYPGGNAYVYERSGTRWIESLGIASGNPAFDQFGAAISISGTRALVGAPRDRVGFQTVGAAYVFDRVEGDWRLTKKLIGTGRYDNHAFGTSVSLSGDRALIGAPGSFSREGEFYIFDLVNGNWVETWRASPLDGVVDDRFGMSVALHGDRALIGAPNDDNGSSNAGSAYVYESDGGAWTQRQKIIASDASQNAFFGSSLSLGSDRALINTYVFDLDDGTWQESVKLDAPDTPSLGRSVALDGDRLLLGFAGGAHVFEFANDAWMPTQRLEPFEPTAGSSVGFSVSLSAGRAIIGGTFFDNEGVNTGASYVFDLVENDWGLVRTLVPSDGAVLDQFGWAVGVSGTTLFSGAPFNDLRAPDAGAVYVYTIPFAVASTPTPRRERVSLTSIAPNPASGEEVRLSYSITEAGPARVSVYDAVGRLVLVLVDGRHSAGAHETSVPAGALAPGVYVVQLRSGASSDSGMLTVAR